MGVSFRFDFDDGELRRKTAALPPRIEAAVSAVVDRQAVLGEARMKTGAPWTDRTSAARTGLHTNASHGGGRHTIVFAHSVHYGIWLEIKNSGKYEIIMPTVRKTGADLMSDLRHLMRRL